MFWTVTLGIILFILILGLIVVIHEFGHFIMARRAGILCHEFSIGMGPVIYQKKIGETVFAIRAIPIGGFVSMAGEEIENNPLMGKKYCQLVIKNDIVEKIIVDYNLFEETEKVYQISNADLIGTADINQDIYIDAVVLSYQEYQNQLANNDAVSDKPVQHFVVSRKAMVVYNSKQTYQLAPWERNFNNKKIGQRFSAVIAGPLMNFVLALIIFFLIGLIQGYPTSNNTIVANLVEKTPAYDAGMRDGDEIVYISATQKDQNTLLESEYFYSWNDVSAALDEIASGDLPVEKVYVYYMRDQVLHEAIVNPNVIINIIGLAFVSDGSNSLAIKSFAPVFGNNELPKDLTLVSVNGVSFSNRQEALKYFTDLSDEVYVFDITYQYLDENDNLVTDDYSLTSKTKNVYQQSGIEITKVQLYIGNVYDRDFIKSLFMPFVEVADSSMLVFKTIGLLAADKSITVKDLSGPVGIAQYTIKIMEGGIVAILIWTATLSVNVGLFNIFPLPALDGGRLAFIGYEKVSGKKANAKVENTVHMIGLILLLALFVFVAFNDTIRIIFGG